ncbi:MAG TPA: lipid-A-disaccharide synthase, partial [Vicinamibacterales bacterium]|nr:lipid-A-disaccharide synthase [Vicinamibacterales bacterium]
MTSGAVLKVCISCGEASGDLYAGALARELRALEPDVDIFGFGGQALRAAGARLVGDYRGLAVTGLVEAVGVLPRSYAMYRRLVAAARRDRPDVFVAVDFPDFNFRVAAAMRRLGVPTVYYVSPQLWAWRPGRMRTMRRLASLVLVIFPFEEPLYRAAGVPVAFVGHPLVDLARTGGDRSAFLHGLGLAADAPTVALLPGSRPNEVRAILPILLAAGRLIETAVPGAQFVLARAPSLAGELFAAAGGPAGPPVTIVEGCTDEVLAAADVALVASGTATVQAALHERPMVIVYRVSPLTYRIGRPFVRVTTFGMVNLIAGRRVVPELVQEAFTPQAVAGEAVSLLTDAARAAAVRAALREVRD